MVGALLESTHRPYRQHLFMNGPTIAHPPRRLQLTEGGGATSHRIRIRDKEEQAVRRRGGKEKGKKKVSTRCFINIAKTTQTAFKD